MKRTIAFLFLALAASLAGAQTTYTTTDGPVIYVDNSDLLDTCQTITVPATANNVAVATVEVTAAHTWLGDLAFEVESPGATKVTVMHKPGTTTGGSGNSDNLISNVPVIYDDAAVSGKSAEDMGDTPCAGDITGIPPCDDNYIPAPDTGGPFPSNGVSLADFNGENPSGVWTLCSGDSAGGDTGTLVSWSITITETPVELQNFDVD